MRSERTAVDWASGSRFPRISLLAIGALRGSAAVAVGSSALDSGGTTINSCYQNQTGPLRVLASGSRAWGPRRRSVGISSVLRGRRATPA
jgi:hypothetical protein